MIVIFDDNNSPHGGWDVKVDGDLAITRDYYPWLNESFLGEYARFIILFTAVISLLPTNQPMPATYTSNPFFIRRF